MQGKVVFLAALANQTKADTSILQVIITHSDLMKIIVIYNA